MGQEIKLEKNWRHKFVAYISALSGEGKFYGKGGQR
jgi:hypothetical protein